MPVDDIIYLRAEGNYLHLQLKDKHHLAERELERESQS